VISKRAVLHGDRVGSGLRGEEEHGDQQDEESYLGERAASSDDSAATTGVTAAYLMRPCERISSYP
jgi:hypothetical protein